jgi:hypothetical protein
LNLKAFKNFAVLDLEPPFGVPELPTVTHRPFSTRTMRPATTSTIHSLPLLSKLMPSMNPSHSTTFSQEQLSPEKISDRACRWAFPAGFRQVSRQLAIGRRIGVSNFNPPFER